MSEEESPSTPDGQNADFSKVVFGKALQTESETIDLLGKLAHVAEPGAVFSAPITAGEYTVITASELYMGLGAGFGSGGGGDATGSGGGSGGGGGGTSMGRPVAVISIGPKGVDVEPVVDPTKIAIAMFTTIGAIFMALRAMRKGK
jgi:uncharacterized spore protein YtfJ